MHTLLIVEDEKMIRQGIKAMIQRSGVPIDIILECGNGEVALEILKSQHVDVMFTDIRMPKMDGIALVKAMQELPHQPLTVAVSGYDEFSYAVEMLRAGVREYILKPVDRDQVKQILEKLDAEITEQMERSENTRMIGGQQLRQLLKDEHNSEAELTAFINEFGHSFFDESYVVCCLDNQNGEPAVEEDYVYINSVGDSEVYAMKEELLEKFRMMEWRKHFVGVSRPKVGLRALREGFLEAKAARESAFWQEKPLIRFGEWETETILPSKEEKTLIPYVLMLGTDKADTAIKQICNVFWNARRWVGHGDLDKEVVSFLEELLKTYEAVLDPQKETLERFKHLYAYAGIKEYENAFVEWLKKFADELNHQFEDYKNKQKIQQAIVYIRENYDKDLNMAVVSNYISMNYSLFSYAFKQYAGTNFVNFLKDIRMEKAKELLEKTDLRVVEISQKIGYENEKHFMKIFKVSFGVSPTEYRKNMQYKRDNQ